MKRVPIEQEQASAPGEHPDSFVPQAAIRSPFDSALLAYLELQPRHGRDGLRDGRRAAMVRALDNRATWNQIKDWRRGWRPAPAWALALLDAKLAARQERASEGRAVLRSA